MHKEGRMYKADLHVHTVLSPCGDVEMSPQNIIRKAAQQGIRILGITDHNSTRNAELVRDLGKKEGILVLTGAEVCTREEVHCLAFFEDKEQLDTFQQFLDEHILKVPNPDGHFGYQPVVDENEMIIEMVPYYLNAALDVGLSDVEREVQKRKGIFVPAHVNRPANGIYSQLGFIPPDMQFDALGISGRDSEDNIRLRYKIKPSLSLLRNSDAHFLHQVGENFSWFFIKDLTFREIKMALNAEDGRKVMIPKSEGP